MKRRLRSVATVGSLCLITALLPACGSKNGTSSDSGVTGGTATPTPAPIGTPTPTAAPTPTPPPTGTGLYTGKTSQASIDPVSVKDGLTGIKDIMPSCTAKGVSRPATAAETNSVLGIIKTASLLAQPTTAKRVGKSVALISPSPQASKNGTCGGTLSYPTYSHASGTTTVTMKWDNYCTTGGDGNKTTYNGTLSMVDAGTPGPNGPVTNNLSANVPSLSVVEKTATGTVVSNETIALTGFVYTPVTGATADLSNLPGSTKFTSFEARDLKNSKDYKFENMTITTSKSGSDTQLTVSGRVYRGTTGYSDLTTDTPLVMDSNQNLKTGKVTFTGANGHKATYTATTGTGQNFTVAVDGTTVTGVQLSCTGLPF